MSLIAITDSGHANRWTCETIAESMRKYHDFYGFPPTAEEWKRAGRWPSHNAVKRHFGLWSAAVEFAGMPRPRPGGCYRRLKRGPYKAVRAKKLRLWANRLNPNPGALERIQMECLQDPELAELVAEQIIDGMFADRAVPDGTLSLDAISKGRSLHERIGGDAVWVDSINRRIDTQRGIDYWAGDWDIEPEEGTAIFLDRWRFEEDMRRRSVG